MNGPLECAPGERGALLAWLAGQLNGRGLAAAVVEVDGTGLLRASGASVRYIACVPAPQCGTWAYVFSGGWVLVDDPQAVDMVRKAMTR